MKPEGRKHGRKQMRTVTRTTRRKENHEQSEELVEEDVSADEQPEVKRAKVDDREQSYNALLTLLKTDHPEEKKKAKASQKVNDEEELAGLNLDAEEDEDDGYSSDEHEDAGHDPFERHFNLVSDEYMDAQDKLVRKEKQKWTVAEKSTNKDLRYTSVVQLPPGKSLSAEKAKSGLTGYSTKRRIAFAYERQYHTTEFSKHDKPLAHAAFNYRDVLYPYVKHANTSYQKIYVTHILNHIFKTRDRVLKNNEKLHNYQAALKDGTAGATDEPEFRDQGFTRPKVLVLLPTRQACYDVVLLLIKLSGAEQQENRKKFSSQFNSDHVPPETKPKDFIEAFKGNNNDFFSIGVKFTRKAVKLYSSFYSSDIIFASPIGLSMILENPDKRKRQYDFLSSIEVLVIDKANHIEMQNWDHVNTVLKYTNMIPKEFHDADFSRIRMWAINDQAPLLRQNLVFCEYATPAINNLISSKSFNLAGKAKFKPIITSETCMMNSIGLKIKQIFQRYDGGANPAINVELRFKYFTNTVLPSLSKTLSYEDGLLIYIPSYFDYLRVKDHMKSSKFTFEAIDEYSSHSKVSRTRTLFLQGKIKVMLYTERLHHFRRYDIAGVKNVLVYGVPTNPLFYKELVQFVGKSIYKGQADMDLSFIKILFSKWDAAALERVVGGERAPILCNSVNEMHEFR